MCVGQNLFFNRVSLDSLDSPTAARCTYKPTDGLQLTAAPVMALGWEPWTPPWQRLGCAQRWSKRAIFHWSVCFCVFLLVFCLFFACFCSNSPNLPKVFCWLIYVVLIILQTYQGLAKALLFWGGLQGFEPPSRKIKRTTGSVMIHVSFGALDDFLDVPCWPYPSHQ